MKLTLTKEMASDGSIGYFIRKEGSAEKYFPENQIEEAKKFFSKMKEAFTTPFTTEVLEEYDTEKE